jgi:hypothetical protein
MIQPVAPVEDIVMATVKDALASMAKNIEATTGKPVSAWVAIARKAGHSKHGEILAWLKEKHGIGHGYANFLAREALKSDDDEGGDDALLTAQFSGSKAALRPLYDQLIKVIGTLGPDVEIAPKKNNVSIRRRKQFALLQPSTATRLDVGLILKGVAPDDRLEASGSFNAMFTHRVRIASSREIDAQLTRWLRAAYDAA